MLAWPRHTPIRARTAPGDQTLLILHVHYAGDDREWPCLSLPEQETVTGPSAPAGPGPMHAAAMLVLTSHMCPGSPANCSPHPGRTPPQIVVRRSPASDFMTSATRRTPHRTVATERRSTSLTRAHALSSTALSGGATEMSALVQTLQHPCMRDRSSVPMDHRSRP